MSTRYEVVATRGTEKLLVGFTARHSRIGMLLLLIRATERSARIREAVRDHEYKTTGRALVFDNDWRVAFTGRTERQAEMEG